MRKKLKLLARPLLLAAMLLIIATSVTSCGHDDDDALEVPVGAYHATIKSIDSDGQVLSVITELPPSFSQFDGEQPAPEWIIKVPRFIGDGVSFPQKDYSGTKLHEGDKLTYYITQSKAPMFRSFNDNAYYSGNLYLCRVKPVK